MLTSSPAAPKTRQRHTVVWVATLLAFVAGCTLAALATWWQTLENKTHIERELADTSKTLAAHVSDRMHRLEYGLIGARGVAIATGWHQLTRETYVRYSTTRNIDREFPGVRGIGIIRRVPPSAVDTFAAHAASDGWPGFHIRMLQPHAQERFVIQYIEPVVRNREAVGLDIGSESNRRQAALAAMESGKATLTAPITLVQATGKPSAGFLLLLPVYPSDRVATNPALRAQQGLGWTYAPLLIHEVLTGLTDEQDRPVSVAISDVDGTTVTTFYTSAHANEPQDKHYATQVDIPVYGRVWRLAVIARPNFIVRQSLQPPRTIALLGFGIAVLFTAAVYGWMRNRQNTLELSCERERRAMALQVSRDAVVLINQNSTIADWNEGAENLFGYSTSQALGQSIVDLLVLPKRRDHALSLMQQCLQGATIPAFDTKALHRDGQAIDVSAILVSVQDKQGRFSGITLSMRDIRPAKEAERAILELNAALEQKVEARTRQLNASLRESEAFLNTVRTFAIVSITDRAGRILDINNNFCQISGYSRSELLGKNHNTVSSGTHPTTFWANMWATISQGQPWRDEVCNRAKNGSLYWVDSMIAPIPNADGRIERYISIRFDVTDRKAYAQQLKQATVKAEAANRAKSEFLANMSHEIRSPLNAVLGLTYLLEQSPLDPEQRSHLKRIKMASDVLLGNVNDILDIAKVEAGELTLAQEAFSIRDMVTNIVAMMSVHAQAKNLPLELTLSNNLPHLVIGDSMRLTQVLNNLLSNAIKFTSRGWVHITLDWQAIETGQGIARLCVSDSGIGMDALTAQRVFDPFVQADSSTTRRFGGTGLGLSIVKKLVALMGGEVGVSSQPGVGSEFWATLPLQVTSAAEPTRPQESALTEHALQGRTILVVDDSDINRDVAKRILQRKGAHVVLADDGAQALACLRDTEQRIDLVLMDMHMPVMDGFEATRRIRQELGQATLPIWALTAGATVSEREMAKKAGVDDFITKPFNPATLLLNIVERLGLQSSLAPSTHLSLPPQPLQARQTNWPSIPGIDMQEVQHRLSNDLALFKTMLKRLLSQPFSPTFDADTATDSTRETFLQDVHKLRGTSGTLGMKTLHSHASTIESCLRNQQWTTAQQILPLLTAELERLQSACQQLLDEPLTTALPAQETGATLARHVTELLALLDTNSMRATTLFMQLSPTLQQHLGDRIYQQLAQDIDNLRFSAAAHLLKEASVQST